MTGDHDASLSGRIVVEVCDTLGKQTLGLQFRESLDPRTVLLFPRMSFLLSPYFHMHNVRFPIDIAALDRECRILKRECIPPETGRFWLPPKTRHVVEAVEGFFDREGLKVGDFFHEVAVLLAPAGNGR